MAGYYPVDAAGRFMSRDALEVTDRIAPMLIGLPVAPDLGAGDVAAVVSALELGAGRSR